MTHHEQDLPVKGKREWRALSHVYLVISTAPDEELTAIVEGGFHHCFDIRQADISLCEPEIMAIEEAVFAEVTG